MTRASAVAAALGDETVLAQNRAKIATLPGSECVWCAGAVSSRPGREDTDGGGHAWFWFAPGPVIIAQRFAFALAHGWRRWSAFRCWGTGATPRCASGPPAAHCLVAGVVSMLPR